MIIDAHTHVWPRWPYQPGVPDSDTRGRAENLVLEMDRAGVDVAFIVNARIDHAKDNNDYGASVAAAYQGRLLQVADIDSRFGADYHRPGAAERLRGTIERFRPVGVSHYLAPENDGWLLSDDGLEFLRVAEDARLILTLAAPPHWYDDLREVARRFPTLVLLVNHLAVVWMHPEGIERALELVLDAEVLPNLLVKVSGYYYGHDRPWDYPYRDRLEVVKAFAQTWGAHRMVWASDWPSLLPHHSYRQSLQILADHADFLSADDIALIQGGTLEHLLRERGAIL